MDKYRRVPKSKEIAVIDESEIRVTAVGSVSAYVSRAAKVFNELNKAEVLVTGTGNAVAKAVQLAEVVKRRVKGLHQITNLRMTEIVDEYEPLEEGLDTVTETRSIPCVHIVLSKEKLDETDKGYQPPLDEAEVKEYEDEELTRLRGRGLGRGKGRGKADQGAKGKDDKGISSKGKGKQDRGSAWSGKGSYEDDYSWPSKSHGSKGKGKGKFDRYADTKGKGSKGGASKSSDWDHYPPPRVTGGGGNKGNYYDQNASYRSYGSSSYSKSSGKKGLNKSYKNW
jgi:DNA-binding protein